jgi:hypothetical protein
MRLFERTGWKSNVLTDEELKKISSKRNWEKIQKAKPFFEADVKQQFEERKAERYPEAALHSPVYQYNDTFVEFRAGLLNNWRGIPTLIAAIFMILVAMPFAISCKVVYLIVTKGFSASLAILLLIGIFAVFLFGSVFVYLYRSYFSLELFTSRYLLVRFNRVTRQVYFHQSKNCGGIIVLPWDEAIHDAKTPQLTLQWYPSPRDNYAMPPTLIAVGNSCADLRKIQAEWEWIRRYMDEGGLKNLPAPKTKTMLPLPWISFEQLTEGREEFLKKAPAIFWFAMICLSPIWIGVGIAGWISLLLCWRPHWQKIIRQAGEPGKPVPKLTTIEDYPPKITALLKQNAHRWRVVPGHDPDKARS